MYDPRKYGYKRMETDIELRKRCLEKHPFKDKLADELVTATGEELDKLAWRLFLERKIIDVY